MKCGDEEMFTSSEAGMKNCWDTF